MRNDLQDILIDCVRHPDSTWKSYRRNTKKSSDIDSDYWNDTAETKARYAKSLSDRLAPVRRFLESRVGKPWFAVWAEICEVTDNRNIRDNHLRDHILWMVENNGISKESLYKRYYLSAGSLYVDDSGYLRKTTGKNKGRVKKVPNRFFKKVGDNVFCLTDHGWFQVRALFRNGWGVVLSDVFSETHVSKLRGVQETGQVIPQRNSYMIQTDTNKPFRFVRGWGKDAAKAFWVAADYRQCNKLEIRSVIQ